MNADLRGLVRELMPALDAYEMAGRRSYHKDGVLHWEMTAQYWKAQRLRERVGAALSAAQGQGFEVHAVLRDFFFDAKNQQHIPTLTVEFEPVPVGAPNDAKGWRDRDALFLELAAAPAQPDGVGK